MTLNQLTTDALAVYPEPYPESAVSPLPNANGHAALAPVNPLPEQPAPEAASRGGAPRQNVNRAKHFLRSERLGGSRLPKGYKSEESHVQRLGRIVRAEYQRRHGRELDAYGQTLLLRILRAERSARWAARHFRKQGDALTLADQKMLLDAENAAGEVIDRAMRQLGLDGQQPTGTPSDWAAMLAAARATEAQKPASVTEETAQ